MVKDDKDAWIIADMSIVDEAHEWGERDGELHLPFQNITPGQASDLRI